MAGRGLPLRRLTPWVVLTVAAHAGLLALPVRPVGAAGTVSPSPVLQVRSIEQATPVVASAGAEWQSGVDTPPPERVVQASPPPRFEPEPARDPTPVPAPSAQVSLPAAQSPGWSLPGIGDEDDAYLVRSLLTVPPAPLAPVVIRYPDAVVAGERHAGELTLFIDETGTVVRVRAETNALPPALEEAARKAFMNVRFRPGELAERGAVKSRIRVEVVFEGGAAPILG